MKIDSPQRLRLGPLEVNIKTGEIRPANAPEGTKGTFLQEKSLRVLRMLMAKQGELVLREEIQKTLWPNDTVVDFDHGIHVAVATLRRALGDSATSPQFIETVPRRGYRLLVPIEEAGPDWPLDEPAPGLGNDSSYDQNVGFGLVGKFVSHFRVLAKLGAGGMGTVYEAEDTKLGRRVALKVLPEEMADDPAALKRFEREARAASSLSHRNICTIYSVEEFERQPVIVMELLKGETLRDRLFRATEQPISLDELLDIALQTCDGLVAAHFGGIVHRDIKPANLLITTDQTAARCVKILDFGLAKLVAAETSNDVPGLDATGSGVNLNEHPTTESDISALRPGGAAGTASYMSPEQIRREVLDARTDLFSFGLVLYEMATGQRAFTGSTAADVQEAVLHQTPVAARDLNSAVSRSLDVIIAKCLEKDREERYQSAVEMAKDLARIQGGGQRPHLRVRKWFVAMALLAVFAAACWLYWSFRQRVTLSESDTVVLGNFDNRTSDHVFDDVLNSVLRYGLEQTPYLNILGIDKIYGTMAQLKLPPTTKLTPDIARQVCLRTNSKLVIDGFIADAGVRYRLELQAVDCQSGKEVLEGEEVADRNQVVHALGVAAAQLRRKLGEPEASLARFNKPLEEARSSSLEALQLGTLGNKRLIAEDAEGAIPYYKRALELDPNLATTYEALGIAYSTLGERDLEVSAYTRGFQLRARMTEPSRLEMEFAYYTRVTGEREKALSALWQSVQTFPRNDNARLNLAHCLAWLGQLDKAADEALEAVRLQPTAFTYAESMPLLIHAERVSEAQATLDEATARKLDSFGLQQARIRMAFLQNNQHAMQEQWNHARGSPNAYLFLFVRSEMEEYYGRFSRARQLIQQALGTAPGTSAGRSYDIISWEDELRYALWEAESGAPTRAKEITATALKSVGNRESELYLALALARAGNTEQARKIADAINQEFPLDTLVQYYHLPTIRAAMKLNANDPAGAIAALQPCLKYELSSNEAFSGLYPAYIRGLAYLQLRNGRSAAAEFQKLLDHRGLVGTDVIGAITYLQMGRAQKMMGDEAAARKSYKTFLDLWKNADPDIPIYRQAKAEFAKLPSAEN
jgi:eukaryotic-like serine/threonine-protein kinase